MFNIPPPKEFLTLVVHAQLPRQPPQPSQFPYVDSNPKETVPNLSAQHFSLQHLYHCAGAWRNLTYRQAVHQFWAAQNSTLHLRKPKIPFHASFLYFPSSHFVQLNLITLIMLEFLKTPNYLTLDYTIYFIT